MTSKEALKELRNDISNRALMFSDEKLDIIEKDLEMLKIIKNHLFINSWGDIIYEPKHQYQITDGVECEMFKPNEEDAKIKEWLSNDK